MHALLYIIIPFLQFYLSVVSKEKDKKNFLSLNIEILFNFIERYFNQITKNK